MHNFLTLKFKLQKKSDCPTFFSYSCQLVFSLSIFTSQSSISFKTPISSLFFFTSLGLVKLCLQMGSTYSPCRERCSYEILNGNFDLIGWHDFEWANQSTASSLPRFLSCELQTSPVAEQCAAIGSFKITTTNQIDIFIQNNRSYIFRSKESKVTPSVVSRDLKYWWWMTFLNDYLAWWCGANYGQAGQAGVGKILARCAHFACTLFPPSPGSKICSTLGSFLGPLKSRSPMSNRSTNLDWSLKCYSKQKG